MDPALWAELEGPPDDVVAALMRLAPGATPPDGVRVITQAGDVATVRLRRGDLLAVRENPAVASLKAPRPMVPDRPNDEPPERPRRTTRSLGNGQPTGRGSVVGIIDWGCDFAHPNLLTKSGKTRLLALWDQRATRGRAPRRYGYGVVYTASEIDRALSTPDPFAALGYDPLDADEDGTGSHGTHVIDIAAGRPRVGPGGVAPGAQLVFVHLASLSWGPRNIASSVCLLEAVDFVSRVAGDRPWVINLSLGSHAGPHDGTTLVEQALDTIVSAGPGRVIVQSCGNYGKRPVHAAGRIAQGERRRVSWYVDPSDETPNEIDLWYRGSDAFSVNLIAPDGRTIARALPDSHGPIVDRAGPIGRFAHRRHDPNNGDNQASMTIEPQRAPRGTWQVELEALTIQDGSYHIWIERDDATRGSQSRLAKRDFVPSTTTGTICNGHHTISVGAYDAKHRSVAWFSSLGPTRDGRAKPDVLARGVGILAARSAPAIDNDEGDELLTCKSGTSMASPHVAGAVAVLYEAAGRPLDAAEVKQILVESGRTIEGGGGPPLVDLRAAVARVRARPMRAESRDDTACCGKCGERDEPADLPLPVFHSARVFDAVFAVGGSPKESLRGLHVIGVPGQRSMLPVRETDIIVRRALGESNLAHVARVSELRQGARGWLAEGGRLPYSALVLREAGGGSPPGPCDAAPQPCGSDTATQEPAAPKRSTDEWLALDTPPAADDAKPDRGIDIKTATSENKVLWTALGLHRVKPIRGLDPFTFPNAYANRTLAVQKFLRKQAIDTRTLGHAIVLDGILGADTLTLLWEIARVDELAFFRTDLTALYVALDRIGAIGFEASRTARFTALPLEITFEWNFETTADQVFALYEKRHTDTEENRLRLQQHLLAGFDSAAWPAFDWTTYLDLMKRVYGTAKVHGRGAMLRGRRISRNEDTNAIAKRDRKAGPNWITWRDLSAGERKVIAAEPTGAAGQRALDEWANSDGDPNVDMQILAYYPTVTEEARLTAVQLWMTDLQQAEIKRNAQNQETLSALAARLSSRLDEDRNFVWEFKFAEEAGQVAYHSLDIRTGMLDELGKLKRLDAFYGAFADMVNSDNRSVAANITKGTTYEKNTAYVAYLEAHKKKTEQIRKHSYDVKKQQIVLDKDSSRVLTVGGVAGDVLSIYKRDHKIDRLKPERQRALCKQVLEELMHLIKDASASSTADNEGKETDPKDLLETAVNKARDSIQPPLGNDDVETIHYEMSVRVTGLRPRSKGGLGGIDNVEIEYEIVERINGGAWTAVPCSKRWRTEQEFGEELFFIFWEHFARVIMWMAVITLAIVAIAFLVMSGVGLLLVRLAGGARFLLVNILLSEAIYVITSGGEPTWEGFLQAALAGYLQAVGFKLFAPIGNWVGRLVAGKATGLSFTRAAATWLITKGVSGGGAFAFQEVATLFTMDLINVMRGGSMSSWKDYLKAAGHGFVMGAVLEIGLGTVITGLGGALKGTVAHKLAIEIGRLAGSAKDALKTLSNDAFAEMMIKAKFAFDDFLFGTAQGLSRFKVWLREVLEDPKLALEAAESVSKHIEESVDALVKKLKASPKAMLGAGKRAVDNVTIGFYSDILSISNVPLGDDAIRGLKRMLADRGKLSVSDITSAMQKLRLLGKSADGVLSLLGALDKEVLARMLEPKALAAVLESKGLASLIGRGAEMTTADLRTLFERGFDGKVSDLDAWVAELDKLPPDAQGTVLGAMRTHIDLMGPAAAVAMIKQGIALDAATLEAVAAMSRASSRAEIDALIAKAPAGLGDVLRHVALHPGDAAVFANLGADVIAHLKGADASVMADVARLAGANSAEVAAAFKTYGDQAAAYLSHFPSPNAADFTKSLADQAKQVRTLVDGLYSGVPETAVSVGSPASVEPAPGWKLETETTGPEWTSTITDPAGKRLQIGRSWDPSSGTLTMNTAFGAPKMEMVPTTPPLIAAKGQTPAMAYVNLHQMRAMKIPYGKGAASSSLKTIKMSTIQNFDTIGHLQWLRTRYPAATLDSLVPYTASYRYAEDIATQAGYRVKSAHVGTSPPTSLPAGGLLKHYEVDARSKSLFGQTGAQRAAVHDDMLGRYGLDAKAMRKGTAGVDVLTNFNIYLELEPQL